MTVDSTGIGSRNAVIFVEDGAVWVKIIGGGGGGGGDATAANQVLGNASLTTIATNTGRIPTGVALADALAQPASVLPVGGFNMLWNGATWDRQLEAPSADAQARTGLAASALMSWNGTTWDRVREPTADALGVAGLLAVGNVVWNGATWDRRRSPTADALVVTGLSGVGLMGFNGTTWDRVRVDSAFGIGVWPTSKAATSADALPNTSAWWTDLSANLIKLHSAGLVFNGTTWDRMRSASPTGVSPGNVGILAASNHIWDSSTASIVAITSARSLGDANTLTLAPGVGAFSWNGTGWDRIRSSVASAGSIAAAATGVLANIPYIWDSIGTAWVPYVSARGTGDANALSSGLATGNYVYNGATWDRLKGSARAGSALVSIAYSSVSDGNSATEASVSDETSSARLLATIPFLFNGSTKDRQRSNFEATVLASAARTASINSADQINYNARGVVVVIDVTAITATPTLTVSIKMKDTLSGKYITLLATVASAINAVGTYTLTIYPGLTAVANSIANMMLSRVWRVEVVADDTDSATYSISANYVL